MYCSALASGGADEWDFGWQMFKKATIAIEADKLMSALACAKNTTLLERFEILYSLGIYRNFSKEYHLRNHFNTKCFFYRHK